MNLQLRPILSALLRNRTGAVLVALQIAIALAVLVNAVFVVKQRVDKINRPTGLDVPNIFAIASSGFTSHYDYEAALREDLAYLRSLDGVVAATASSAVPLSGSGNSQPLLATPSNRIRDDESYNDFDIDEQGLQTLGVKLIAGRAFRADEILPPLTTSTALEFSPQVIVTQNIAQKLFPHENAVGKTVYSFVGKPAVITGVIENMHGAWPWSDKVDMVFLTPRRPFTYGGPVYYLVRTKPGQRDAVMRIAEEHLSASNPDRVIKNVRSLELFKQRVYLDDRNMAIFLVTVVGLLLAITSLGIFGLATFNVSTRTKQIGTRRAVGARRLDIVRYFMVENWLVTTTGVIVGCALALGVGYWLSLQFKLPRLDLYYLVGGILVLWAVGQAAAWQPSRRASRISPAIATRTV